MRIRLLLVVVDQVNIYGFAVLKAEDNPQVP